MTSGYNPKQVRLKIMKSLLDLIVLEYLSSQPMHGYKIISRIRKQFGQYFGPSTIYPLLNSLEKKGYTTSEWGMNNERPVKVYKLTSEGQNLLNLTEDSLNFILGKVGIPPVFKQKKTETSDGVTIEISPETTEEQKVKH